MSNLEREAVPSPCGGRGFVVAEPCGSSSALGTSSSASPARSGVCCRNLGRRMVGAWCFVDHYGPDDIADEPGMQVPPHPHMGLQTVSWLHEGAGAAP
ncbi:pirin family protein [Streptomyces hirsutus]